MTNSNIPHGDMHMYICWQKRAAVYTNYYLTPDERRTLVATVGDPGLLLFEYLLYMAKQSGNDEVIDDDRIAHWFGWNTHKAKRYRLKLIKANWLLIEKYKNPVNDTAFFYYLGKPAVEERRGYLEGQKS